MEVKTEITKEKAIVKIILQKKKSRLEDQILVDSFAARAELLKKHPDLNISRKPEILHHISNGNEEVCGEWVFNVIVDSPKLEDKKPSSKKPIIEKVSKKPKNILNFKPKDAKVVETTAPEQTDQVKGVEEPTE